MGYESMYIPVYTSIYLIYTGIYQYMQFSSILSYAIVYGGLGRRSLTNLKLTVAYEAILPPHFEYACIYCHMQLCYMMS